MTPFITGCGGGASSGNVGGVVGNNENSGSDLVPERFSGLVSIPGLEGRITEYSMLCQLNEGDLAASGDFAVDGYNGYVNFVFIFDKNGNLIMPGVLYDESRGKKAKDSCALDVKSAVKALILSIPFLTPDNPAWAKASMDILDNLSEVETAAGVLKSKIEQNPLVLSQDPLDSELASALASASDAFFAKISEVPGFYVPPSVRQTQTQIQTDRVNPAPTPAPYVRIDPELESYSNPSGLYYSREDDTTKFTINNRFHRFAAIYGDIKSANPSPSLLNTPSGQPVYLVCPYQDATTLNLSSFHFFFNGSGPEGNFQFKFNSDWKDKSLQNVTLLAPGMNMNINDEWTNQLAGSLIFYQFCLVGFKAVMSFAAIPGNSLFVNGDDLAASILEDLFIEVFSNVAGNDVFEKMSQGPVKMFLYLGEKGSGILCSFLQKPEFQEKLLELMIKKFGQSVAKNKLLAFVKVAGRVIAIAQVIAENSVQILSFLNDVFCNMGYYQKFDFFVVSSDIIIDSKENTPLPVDISQKLNIGGVR